MGSAVSTYVDYSIGVCLLFPKRNTSEKQRNVAFDCQTYVTSRHRSVAHTDPSGSKSHVCIDVPPPVAIRQLPQFTVSSEQAKERCDICLEALGDAKVTAGDCLHKFHYICMSAWLACDANKSCPVCRQRFQRSTTSDVENV